MYLEITILSEVGQKQKDKMPYDNTYMWNLKYDRNETINETETESGTQRTDWRLPRDMSLGRDGRLGLPDVNFHI